MMYGKLCLYVILIFISLSNLYCMDPRYSREHEQELETRWIGIIYAKIMDLKVDLTTKDVAGNDIPVTVTDTSLTPAPFGAFMGKGKESTVTPLAYLKRIQKYCPCDSTIFISTLIYIQRIIAAADAKNVTNFFNNISFHRIYLTAFVLASKCNDDHFYSNKFYSQVGGIPLNEMNALEICFLNAIDSKIYISRGDWNKCIKKIHQFITEKQITFDEIYQFYNLEIKGKKLVKGSAYC